MNTKQIHDAIQALDGLPPATLTARLRVIHPAIEARAAAGIRHAAILAALNEAGWNISLASYKGILQRLRRQARECPAPTPSPRVATTTPTAQAVVLLDPSPDPRTRRELVAKAFIPETPVNKFAARIAAQTQEKKS